MNYYVSMTEVDTVDVQNVDVYIGESEPTLPEGSDIKKFTGEVSLRSFLMKGRWDKATLFKSPDCPQELVDELAEWMAANMSLENVIAVGGD